MSRVPGDLQFDTERAVSLLRVGTGMPDARFRPGQEDAIRSVVTAAARRLLFVQKTGWGKSFVYFIATRLLREGGFGPTLLVSPLLSLMRNQIAAAERMGVRAETIHSDNTERWDEVEEAVVRGAVDILLISPERLANVRFQERLLARIADRIALLVIDEAHCISDWGHDFRPHYRLIERIVRSLPPNLRVLATTATANKRVMEDLGEILGPTLQVSRGDLARPSLALQTIDMPGQDARLAWLAEHLPAIPGSGIVYTLTVRDAERVAGWLRFRGIDARAYSSEARNRETLEQDLLDNRVKALVATTALGMGFDKPDLAFVIHYQAPGSVVAYYQQVGRAGRSLPEARGVLLSGHEDPKIVDWFIRSAFPTRPEVEAILGALEAAEEGLSIRDIEREVNVRNSRIQKTLQLLSLESPAPIAKLDARWQLTAATLSDAFWSRAERLTELRHQEQAQIQEYVRLRSGHMAFLIRALDGDAEDAVRPGLPPLPTSASRETIDEARAFLRRSSLAVKPRRRWPPGKAIESEHIAQPGKALCTWGDAGWGGLVKRGKYQDGRFADALVDACVALLREWGPEPPPSWVTAIPSSRHPKLVPDFARRLAGGLGLHFRDVLAKKEGRPEQKTMENSDKQARNVLGSLDVEESRIPEAQPVLLVDDIVDARWTFTVAAWELRRHGCGAVWPLALADAGGSG